MRVRSARMTGTTLVIAARSGDRDALNELARAHLPLVYNLVRRALNGDPDVDDLVQDIMVRALRQLAGLRSPASFRPWLMAIAVRQVGTHLARDETAAGRLTSLDEIAGRPDEGAEFEGAALLRAEVTRQRRQVMHAGRWLDADDRALLSLWWLETAGELDRSELADALGVTVAHAGVRLQRMREQLELSRSIVVALEAVPGCSGLTEVTSGWDGTPSPFWRKRAGRHIRSCPICRRTDDGTVPTDRLLLGLALFPVPAGLAAALIGRHLLAGTTGASWSLAKVASLAAAHPVVATVTAGVLAVGVTAGTTDWAPLPHLTPAVIAAPKPPGTGVRSAPAVGPSRPGSVPLPPAAAGAMPVGKVSLEAADAGGKFVAASDVPGSLQDVSRASAAPNRAAATFEVIPGFADSRCYSFRAADGRFLRHASFRLRLSPDEGTVLFRRDATFCARAGADAASVALESVNFPGYLLRHLGDELWVDQYDGSTTFLEDSSFLVRPPLR